MVKTIGLEGQELVAKDLVEVRVSTMVARLRISEAAAAAAWVAVVRLGQAAVVVVAREQTPMPMEQRRAQALAHGQAAAAAMQRLRRAVAVVRALLMEILLPRQRLILGRVQVGTTAVVVQAAQGPL